MKQTCHFGVGSFDCVVIRDGNTEVPASFLFTNAPPKQLEHILDTYQLEPGRIPASFAAIVIQTGKHLILVDTGMGDSGHGSQSGQLFENLKAIDIANDDIDVVILTHAHPDHISGSIDRLGNPMFRNARYMMSKVEWLFWTDEANLAKMDREWAKVARQHLLPLHGRIELYDQETQILPGIQLVPAPGHTPGHMAVLVQSNDEHLLCAGDALGYPITLEYPDWMVATDFEPDLVLATRKQLLTRAVDLNALIFSNHFVFPGIGHAIPTQRAWRWQPHQVPDVSYLP